MHAVRVLGMTDEIRTFKRVVEGVFRSTRRYTRVHAPFTRSTKLLIVA